MPLKKEYLLLGIFPMEWIDESEYFFFNCWESDAYWSTFADDSERQKTDSLSIYLTAKVTPITAVMSFLIVVVS